MNKSITLRRILLAPPSLRTSLFPLRTSSHPAALNPRAYSTPSVTQTSFWASLIPKPLRQGTLLKAVKKNKSKEWNPATFFIFIFLFIGSMSIQMIALRNEYTAFMRRADAKIGLLKEVIERIQKGEEVDVEGLLGTGDAKREKEWEEVLQEIEQENEVWEQSRKPKPKHGQESKEARAPIVEAVARPPTEPKPKTNAPSGFF
ncbi:hypothetical protein M430DRAFT_140003 [Amorphotheca resinae ATCC 22711]|uniref:Uncharacterized protein n=1 Tax=Amorphotheca resinae ATCC 22711 TaxID=857342 RepID=A0A2T3B233_AMORE|nr:hypothetical protein M430DRAFT_140003 [Amorphotheca resinae ATCC 22711]PSS18620.1 hypothetical protein M430DRAFT_140003 [Amorphotheca resinae ATCC 22711]